MDTYPGSTDEAHPELFNMSAMPEQPKEQKAGQLSREEVEHFFREVWAEAKFCITINTQVDLSTHFLLT